MSIVPDFRTATFYADLTRHSHVAGMTIVLWDYVLTFDREVELFWSKRWSTGKVLYLISRYFGIAFSIFNAWGLLKRHPSLDFCLWWFQLQSAGGTAQMMVTHIILQLRLYALYNRSKKILWFFVWMTLFEAAISLYVFEAPGSGEIRTNTPAPGVYICADADPPNKHVVVWWAIQSAIIEAVLLGFAIYNAFYYYGKGYGGLIDVMRRDSVMYFSFVFTVYICNVALWFHNNISLNETLTSFVFALSFIFANRLLINIRIVYYEHELSSIGTLTSGPMPTFNHELEDFELEDCRSKKSADEERAGPSTQPRDLEQQNTRETSLRPRRNSALSTASRCTLESFRSQIERQERWWGNDTKPLDGWDLVTRRSFNEDEGF